MASKIHSSGSIFLMCISAALSELCSTNLSIRISLPSEMSKLAARSDLLSLVICDCHKCTLRGLSLRGYKFHAFFKIICDVCVCVSLCLSLEILMNFIARYIIL